MLLEFTNLFFAGILAGIEICAHYGMHSPTLALEEKPQIILRQGLVRRLRWLVPAFFVPTALSGIAVAIVDRGGPGRWVRIAAVLAILVWIYVRIVATVGINSATLDWNPDAPPTNWRELVNRAERFHTVGMWAAVIVFVCFLVSAAH